MAGPRVNPEVKTYLVKPGDTLRTIAKTHKTTVEDLRKDNPELTKRPRRDRYGNKIYPGDEIKIFQRKFCGQERGGAIVGCEAVSRDGRSQVQAGVGHVGPDDQKYLLGVTAGDPFGTQVYGGLIVGNPDRENLLTAPASPELGWKIGIRFSFGQ